MTSELTVREAFFDFCRSVGMTTLFGNPGSTELRMFRDFPADFEYVLALQETVAVAAAAGHSLGTGNATLVSLHSAGGVGHSLGAVFNAYRDRVPVVVIAGQQSRAMLPHHPFLGADERRSSRARTSSGAGSPSAPRTCPPRSPRRTGSR
ncbi:thiamine pyrophosphate-binding protein [Actinomadura madurae]|uniref:thiamine pyrophosphate-binding protein n=1 Tax=Actinomadura madurae TaxID=1993 RepID=UPI0020D1F97F|nr:thiamine pyrophosphate-binding protein [Actinomadura madurae]MCQ0014357.1 thiamine pyrophosphate-binding protein [Actinomadura madurae]